MRILILLALLLPAAAHSQHREEDFSQYWSNNRIEVSIYELSDAKGNNIGKATLRFCAEDFSRSKQVRLEDPKRNPLDAVRVLESHLRIEDASNAQHIALSTFTPINREKYPHSFKTAASLQNATGQFFAQINLQTYKYRMLQYSYLEQEADQEHIIEKAYLENEFFNLLRSQNHAELPTGAISLVPSLLHLRPSRVLEAEAELQPHTEKPEELLTYSIKYDERSVLIHFQRRFPYIIEGWEEWQGTERQVSARRTQSTHER